MSILDIAQYRYYTHQVLVRHKLPDVALGLGEGDAGQPPGLLPCGLLLLGPGLVPGVLQTLGGLALEPHLPLHLLLALLLCCC